MFFILFSLIATLVNAVPIQFGSVSYATQNQHRSSPVDSIYPYSILADSYRDKVLTILMKRETIDEYNAAHPRNLIPGYLICMDTVTRQSRYYTADEIFQSLQEALDVVNNRPTIQLFPGWAGMRFPIPIDLFQLNLPVVDLGTHNGRVMYYPLRPNYAATGGNPWFDFPIPDGNTSFMGVIMRVPGVDWIWCVPVLLNSRQNQGASRDSIPGANTLENMHIPDLGWIRPFDTSDSRVFSGFG